jgi:hypothetical protein
MKNSLIQKIDASHSRLENLVKIGNGMQTGANEIFVFKDKPLQFPRQWLKKRITASRIEKYAIMEPTDHILYFEEINDFKQFPTSIQQYLLSHQTQLANRSAKNKKAKWWNYALSSHKNYYHLDKLWCSSGREKNGFAYDDTGEYIGLTDTLVIFDTNKDISLKYLLALLNSSLLKFRYKAIGQPSGKSIGKLPIVLADKKTQQHFTILVDYVIYLKQQSFYHSKDLRYAQDRLVVSFFEQIIDGMVYELYLPEDLHQEDKFFIDVLAKENLPSFGKIKGNKISTLRTIFDRMFDKEHCIRHNLFFLDSLPIIRIVEGKPYYANYGY